MKQDRKHNVCLVAGGHLVDFLDGISSRSIVVKGISVRLLDILAHRKNLVTLYGNIGNAFLTWIWQAARFCCYYREIFIQP